MPCDDGSPALERKISDLQADMRRLHDRLDRYAQMMCKVIDKLRLTEAHKNIDAVREAKEAAEAKAIKGKKIGEYEQLKRALGL